MDQVVKKWAQLTHEYSRRVRWNSRGRMVPDASYWTTERATLSVLAAAAWRCGGVALEEYGDIRGEGKGRVDLYIKRRKHEYVIEAKQIHFIWPGIKQTTISSRLQSAENSIREQFEGVIQNSKAERRLGVIFLVPSFRGRPGASGREIGELVRKGWPEVLGLVQASAFELGMQMTPAMVGPSVVDRTVKACWACPGVFLLRFKA